MMRLVEDRVTDGFSRCVDCDFSVVEVLRTRAGNRVASLRPSSSNVSLDPPRVRDDLEYEDRN